MGVRLLAAAVAALLTAGCGAMEKQGAGVSTGAADTTRIEVATDINEFPDTPGVGFVLGGAELTVTIAEDVAPETEKLLDRDVTFLCGTEEEFGPYGASAIFERRFPPGEREVTVTLSRDLGEDAYFCGVEAKDGTAEAFSFGPGG